jgi:hypothetical protein
VPYLAETRRLAVDEEGRLWRKGRETARRLIEPRCLGHVTEPLTSWRVSRPLEREFEDLLDAWEDSVSFALACREEAEATYAATRGV